MPRFRQQLILQQEDKVLPDYEPIGSYKCRHCGERHASDDTELWCGIAQNMKKKPIK